MTNKLTIAFTRREAELYRSHGLLEEAHQLYRQVLDESGVLGPSLTASLQEKIDRLEKDLTELDINLSGIVSERELNILREGWGDASSPSDISTCASALSSIGLHEAAIEEYGKLIHLNQPHADYIDGLTDSIVAAYAPEIIGDAVEAIVACYQPPEAHSTRLRIGIAVALARRGLDQQALTLFKSARAIQPLPVKVETFVNEIKMRRGQGEESIDSGLSAPTKEESNSRQIKIYFANRLAGLRELIRRLHRV